MRHFFLSPHLDYAVASCGGLIAKLVYQRDEVSVISIYTKNPDLTMLSEKYQ